MRNMKEILYEQVWGRSEALFPPVSSSSSMLRPDLSNL